MQTLLGFFKRHLFTVLALCLLVWVVLRAVMDPLLCWDPFMYHLPFAILLWDIGGGELNHSFSSEVIHRMPIGLVGQWFQGALWKLLGSPNFVSLVNIIPLYTAFFYAWRWLGVSFPFLVFLTFSMPMIAIHATSGYIDLMNGGLILISVVAALHLLSLREEKFGKLIPPLAVLFISAVFAGNAKYSALIPALAIVGLTFLKMLLSDIRLRRGAVSACLVICALCVSVNVIKNTIRYQNPFYPVNISILGIKLQGLDWFGYPKVTPSYLEGVPLKTPLAFIASVTELDWLINPPATYLYSEASQAADSRPGGRTGGLFGPLIVAQMMWLIVGFWRLSASNIALPNRKTAHHALHFLLIITVGYSLQNASSELRYSLAWPLVLVLINALLFSYYTEKMGATYSWVIAMLIAGFLAIQLFLPMQRTLFSTSLISYYPESVRKHTPPAVLKLFRRLGGACVNYNNARSPYNYDFFGACGPSVLAYSPAFNGEQYKIHIGQCRHYNLKKN